MPLAMEYWIGLQLESFRTKDGDEKLSELFTSSFPPDLHLKQRMAPQELFKTKRLLNSK